MKNALGLRFLMLSHSIKILTQMFSAVKTFQDVILECKLFRGWCLLHIWKWLEQQSLSLFGVWRKERNLLSSTCMFGENVNPWRELSGYPGNNYLISMHVSLLVVLWIQEYANSLNFLHFIIMSKVLDFLFRDPSSFLPQTYTALGSSKEIQPGLSCG